MKTSKFISLIVSGLIQSTFLFCQNNPKDFPVLKGPYLGQALPGKPGHHFQIYWVKADFIQKLQPVL